MKNIFCKKNDAFLLLHAARSFLKNGNPFFLISLGVSLEILNGACGAFTQSDRLFVVRHEMLNDTTRKKLDQSYFCVSCRTTRDVVHKKWEQSYFFVCRVVRHV
jgi:hypothetical protein